MFLLAGIPLDPPFVLAPLAGYSDLPFRLLCREYGAALTVSEMISCHGLIYRQKKTLKMLASCPADQPVSFQLFGADPDIMAEATAILGDFSPSLIDINMGCPVRKVTKRGAGSALMRDIALAEKILRAVVSRAKVPVTVKTRAGVDAKTETALEFTRMCQTSGAAAITIHGRTWAQGFSGRADWEVVRRVKEIATIPVIGNGDVESYEQGMARMAESGCDAIMIGRAALGNPWVFQKEGRPDTIEATLPAVKRHLALMEQHLDTVRVLSYIKNHTGRYFSHFPGSSLIRKNIHACNSFQELLDLVYSLA
ncbi:MAG: tRNA dihydrouridine synthase DusB [Thermodesulfobacteriota bacterium]